MIKVSAISTIILLSIKKITCCLKNADPKELKRQRERERYALNRDDILRRKKEAREHKNDAAAMDNGNSEANALVSPSVASHGECHEQLIYTSHVCSSHRLLIFQNTCRS